MSDRAFKLSRKLLTEFKLESSFVTSIEQEVVLKVIASQSIQHFYIGFVFPTWKIYPCFILSVVKAYWTFHTHKN